MDPATFSALQQLTPIDTYLDSAKNVQYGLQSWTAADTWRKVEELTGSEIPVEATAMLIAPLDWSMVNISIYYMFSPSLLDVVTPTAGLYLMGYGTLPIFGRQAMRLLRMSAGKPGYSSTGVVQYFTGDVGPFALPVHGQIRM